VREYGRRPGDTGGAPTNGQSVVGVSLGQPPTRRRAAFFGSDGSRCQPRVLRLSPVCVCAHVLFIYKPSAPPTRRRAAFFGSDDSRRQPRVLGLTPVCVCARVLFIYINRLLPSLSGGVLLSSALMTRVANPESCIDQKDAAGTYDMFDAKLGNCVFYLGITAVSTDASNTDTINTEQTAQHQDN